MLKQMLAVIFYFNKYVYLHLFNMSASFFSIHIFCQEFENSKRCYVQTNATIVGLGKNVVHLIPSTLLLIHY